MLVTPSYRRLPSALICLTVVREFAHDSLMFRASLLSIHKMISSLFQPDSSGVTESVVRRSQTLATTINENQNERHVATLRKGAYHTKGTIVLPLVWRQASPPWPPPPLQTAVFEGPHCSGHLLFDRQQLS